MMKISYENFDKLNTVEYQEYKYLKKKDFNGEKLGIFLAVLFHLAVSSIVALAFSKGDDQIGVFLICIFLPFCWFPTVMIAVFLEEFYKKIYRYIFNNQNAYIRFKEFEKKYPPIENEIKSQLRNYVDFHLKGLIRQLRKNISNQQEHKDLIETFKLNHWFVEDASELLGISIYETKYKSILRKEDVWFEDDLLKIKEKEEPKKTLKNNIFYNLGKKVSNTFTPRKSSSKKSFTSLGNIKPQTIGTATKPKVENQNVQTEKSRENKSSQFTEGILQNTPDIPTKKNRIIRPRIIKASDKFWEELGKKRIEIGKKGEMLVMDYERKRIISEEGKDFLNRLQYSALIEGDGLGYDITSFENGCKIYIEVKTTTGNFWNGLFFTQTELDTMKKIGNKYYLYRIYDFDKSTSMGKLKVFKGCEEIQSQFDFSPQTYILKPKA